MDKKDINNKKKLKSKNLDIGGILPKGTSDLNKTGSWKDKIPIVDEDKCINCMMCVNACPENVIDIKEDKSGKIKRSNINYDYCKGCGICANVCPVGAIKMYSKKEGLEILKNKKYKTLKNKKKELKKT